MRDLVHVYARIAGDTHQAFVSMEQERKYVEILCTYKCIDTPSFTADVFVCVSPLRTKLDKS